MQFVNTAKKPDENNIEAVLARFQAGEVKDGDKVTLKGTLQRIKEMTASPSSTCARPAWSSSALGRGGQQGGIKDFSVEECVLIEGTIVYEEHSGGL